MNIASAELSRTIDAHAKSGVEMLLRWSAINSGTHHQAGLARMADELTTAFAELGAEQEWIDLPPAESIDASGAVVRTGVGRGLRLVKRAGAARSVFLCIHYDTVYGPEHSFQHPRWSDAN